MYNSFVSFRQSAAFKLWIIAIIYVLALLLGLGFIFPNSHIPVWFELLFKGTAALAFTLIVLIPVLYVATHHGQKTRSQALTVAAYITFAGYVLLFGQLLYVRLKTCDVNAIVHDGRWHCNVSGKGVVFYVAAIPILAAVIGLLASVIQSFIRRRDEQ